MVAEPSFTLMEEWMLDYGNFPLRFVYFVI
jgi:hypothetical protein